MTTSRKTFEVWVREVDNYLMTTVGMTHENLPSDELWWNKYNRGEDPVATAKAFLIDLGFNVEKHQ